MAKTPTKTEDKTNVPATQYDWGADADAGYDDIGAGDLSIPMLYVIQKTSPQVDPDKGEYLDNAKPGMFINSVTNELFDGKRGIGFQFIRLDHKFVAWTPRDEGGGLVGVFAPTDPLVLSLTKNGRAFGKLKTPDGHDLVETYQLFAQAFEIPDGVTDAASVQAKLDAGEITPMRFVVPFASTQIKKIKALNTMLVNARATIKAPAYAFLFKATTVGESNKKGSWAGLKTEWLGGNARAALLPPSSPLVAMGKEFRDLIIQGAAKVDMEGGTDPGDYNAADDNTIPF